MDRFIFPTGGVMHLEFERATLEPGFSGCRLAFLYTPRIERVGPVVILLSGALRAELSSGTRWLGTLHGSGGSERYITASSPQIKLSLSLGFEQLLALEHARAGDDLRLQVDLRAVVVGRPWDPSKAVPPEAAAQRLSVTIHRDEWAKQLDRIGTTAIVPILVPIPVGGAESRLGAAGQHLREAQQALRDHRPEDAIRVARRALDIIRELDPQPDPISVPRKQRSLPQRFAGMQFELFSLASGAAHDDEVTKDFRYMQAEAIAIVASIAGLLARLDERARG